MTDPAALSHLADFQNGLLEATDAMIRRAALRECLGARARGLMKIGERQLTVPRGRVPGFEVE